MAHIQDILVTNFKGCQYSIDEDYQSLVWSPDNLVLKPTEEEIIALSDATDLTIAKNSKISEIEAQRDANKSKAVLGSCSGQQYYFQRSLASHLAFINASQNSEEIAVTDWITEDNIIVDLTCGELRNICAHLRDRDSQEHVQARKRKDAVGLLTTVEEVQNYDITQVYVD